MCLTFFAINPLENKKQINFLIAFNRDEQTKRQTLPFEKFQDDSNIYAGRDMISLGTWLGFNIKTGLFVFLTNFDLIVPKSGLSRGRLIKKLLSSQFASQNSTVQQLQKSIQNELQQVLNQRSKYLPCNIVVYSIFTNKTFYICTQLSQNKMEKPLSLQEKKHYGLCNTDIHTIWPKTGYGLQKFKQIMKNAEKQQHNEETILKDLQNLMKDKKCFTQNPQDQSSIFIQPYYCVLQKAQRMTKSTFLAIFKKGSNNNPVVHYKQISFQNNLNQSVKEEIVQFKKLYS